MYFQQNRDPSISDQSIIVTAVSCLLGLIVVIGAALLISRLTRTVTEAREEIAQEAEPEPPKVEPTVFREGYSIVLPEGFKDESREETEEGWVVYRFQGEDSCRFTFVIIPDESVDRFTNPPSDYSETVVESIRELSQDIEGEVDPVREVMDGMSASVFRFYEKETFRGVNFTYLMYAIDRGKNLILKIDGKYKRYHADDTDISMPEHWYDALKTFRRLREQTPSS